MPADKYNKKIRTPAAVAMKPSKCWEDDPIDGYTLKVDGTEVGAVYPHYRHIPDASASEAGGEWCWRWRTTTEEGWGYNKETAMLSVEEKLRARAKAILAATGGP